MKTKTVEDVMSRELVYLTEETRAKLALPYILRFGITAVPVLDADHRPIGVVSLRDIAGNEAAPTMSTPAKVVSSKATLEQAARAIAEADCHHIVAVDADGCAVGMVSALDVLRGLVGAPVRHPVALEAPAI